MAASHDEAFFALPKYLQRRIDSAFDSTFKRASRVHTVPGSSEPAAKRKKLNPEESAAGGGGFLLDESQSGGGGFILDDQNVDSGGGFLMEDAPGNESGGGFVVEDSSMPVDDDVPENAESEESLRIPLSFIPTALQLLDLDPDDEQVLAVFRNAASDWNNSNEDTADEALAVSQKDWRAVCAILLEPGAGDSGTEGGEFISNAEDDASSDFDIQMHSGDEDNPDSDDNYEPDPSPTKSSRRTRSSTKAAAGGKRRARFSRDSSDSEESEFDAKSRPLTSRQKAACLETFAMFFPDASTESEDDLRNRRIMLTDIQRVAKLLGEKLKAEEFQMLEMLEVFSTSPDKSMSLQDFERMMVTAKLV
ncbi:hypothetical protein GYMLUDRAFT_636770 [Collybiopsis luxurians FD-317 M1]|nr:hypothetical protein GYMLUDRAFT_636770 [Collybiopsis luxurians FD-317 M1]